MSGCTVISDARTEHDPPEGTRMPEQCRFLFAVTNGESIARINAVMRIR